MRSGRGGPYTAAVSSPAERLSDLLVDEPEMTPSERLTVSFQLTAFGERMFVARLRRDDPRLTDQEIADRVAAWYGDRPMDTPGEPISWSNWLSKRR